MPISLFLSHLPLTPKLIHHALQGCWYVRNRKLIALVTEHGHRHLARRVRSQGDRDRRGSLRFLIVPLDWILTRYDLQNEMPGLMNLRKKVNSLAIAPNRR